MSFPPAPPHFLTDSLCFSSASILRCSPLSEVENAVLIIPTALEVVFTIALVFIVKDGGWHHLFLTVETCLYLILAVLEVISHVLPAARDSVHVTKGFNLAIGILAPLPLLLYLSFLYLFARQEFVYSLPRRLQRILSLMLPIFIPAITVMNTVAGFVGVQIRMDPRSPNTPLIGFASPRESTLWSFFTSFTLALLTLYQAIIFLTALHRLLSVLISQRRIESTSQDAIHLVKGVGWINAAIKLGALESVLGFVSGSFGLFMVRRILRFAARAAWCIGIARGVDELEDFRAIQSEMSRSASRRNGNLRTLISNPRLSTFREMSPSATMFHSTLRQTRPGESAPTVGQFSKLRNEMYVDGIPNVPGQRVTISYDRGTPMLHMRLSSVQLPDPAQLAESIKARNRRSSHGTWVHGVRGSRGSVSGFVPLEKGRERMSTLRSMDRENEKGEVEYQSSFQEKAREKSWISQWTEAEKRSSYFPPTYQNRESLSVPPKIERNSSSQLSSVYTPSLSEPPQIVSASRRTMTQTSARGVIIPSSAVESTVLDVYVTAPSMLRYGSVTTSHTEGTSMSPDTVDILRELTPQFPDTPMDIDENPPPSAASSEGFTPRLTAQDKGKTPIRGGLPSPASSKSSRSYPIISRPQLLRPMPSPKRSSALTSSTSLHASKRQSIVSPGVLDFGTVLSQNKTREWKRDSVGTVVRPNSTGIATSFMQSMKSLQPPLEMEENNPKSISITMPTPATGKTTIASTDGLSIPWLRDPELDEDSPQPRTRIDSSTSSVAYPMRIKSYGNAPRKATPLPMRSRVAKRSTHLEPLIIPPLPHSGNTEVVQDYNAALESRDLRDSEVLGMDDARMVTQQLRDVRAYYAK